MNTVYLGLGSNLGKKEQNLTQALKLIEDVVGKILVVSSYSITKPYGFESDNTFVNAVAKIETALAPIDLLYQTQSIEKQLGRTRKTIDGNYSDRIIDIDILLYNDWVIETPELKIPHPLMEKRDFVLIPLLEIAPNLIHPKTGKLFADNI